MAAELHTEGLQFILEAAFSEEQAVPANFYIGLATDASLAEDAAMTDVTELAVANNYARKAVASSDVGFTSAAAGTADRKVTTAQVQFECTGSAWSGAQTVFLTTDASGTAGKLIASQQLSATRTLQPSDTLDITMVIQLNG